MKRLASIIASCTLALIGGVATASASGELLSAPTSTAQPQSFVEPPKDELHSGQSQEGTQTAENKDQSNQQVNVTGPTTTQQVITNQNTPVQGTVFGDNTNHATQGNGNSASTTVVQVNDAEQTQSNEQGQLLNQQSSGSSCCSSSSGQSQTGTQEAENKNQSNQQQNVTTLTETQQVITNQNTPIQGTVKGDNTNYAKQGNHNDASTTVVQVNEAEQTQSNKQGQVLNQQSSGGSKCCDSGHKKDYGKKDYKKDDKKDRCCDSGQSQTGTQNAQNKNQSNQQVNVTGPTVTQQVITNVNTPIQGTVFGDNTNYAKQGNGNDASTTVVQVNDAEQTQSNKQGQILNQQSFGGHDKCCDSGHKKGHGKGDKKDRCCDSGQSQTGTQNAQNKNQSNQQVNVTGPTVTQQVITNVNTPIQGTVFGDNTNYAKQGNGNSASTTVVQVNDAEQTQSNEQGQILNQQSFGGDKCCRSRDHWKKDRCCGGSGQDQTGTQNAKNKNQRSQQVNVTGPTVTQQVITNVNTPIQGSVFGDNTNHAEQGNHNDASTTVIQVNDAEQTQSNKQGQILNQQSSDRGSCCPKKDRDFKHDNDKCGCDGRDHKGKGDHKPDRDHKCDCGDRDHKGDKDKRDFDHKCGCADRKKDHDKFKKHYGKKKHAKSCGCSKSPSQHQSGTQNAENKNQRNQQVNVTGPTITQQVITNINTPIQGSVFGDNTNYAKQGNHNDASTTVVQINEVEQTQKNEQFQLLNQQAL